MNDLSLKNLLDCIGQKLHDLRHKRREKLETVSRATGISEPTISKIENGRYLSLSLKMLAKLSSYYDKKVDEVISPEN